VASVGIIPCYDNYIYVIHAAGKAIRETISRGGHTVPSTIAEEKLTNVFLRAPNAKVFAALRRKKDVF